MAKILFWQMQKRLKSAVHGFKQTNQWGTDFTSKINNLKIKTKKFTNLKNNPVNLNQTGVDHTLKQ